MVVGPWSLMDKALSPYIAGGGAKKFEERVLGASYGIDADADLEQAVEGFQAMKARDALTVLNDVPFSIPPYFRCLEVRAFVTLEGIAARRPRLRHHPGGLPLRVAQTIEFRDRPAARRALQEALYAGAGRDDGSRKRPQPRRLAG